MPFIDTLSNKKQTNKIGAHTSKQNKTIVGVFSKWKKKNNNIQNPVVTHIIFATQN